MDVNTMTQPRPVRADARGRLSLGVPNAEYLLHEQPDGSVILEPAVTISTMEAALLANGQLQDRIERAHQGTGLISRAGGRRDRTVHG